MVFFAVWVTSSSGFSELTFPVQTLPLECSLLDLCGFHPRVHHSASMYWAPALNQGHWCKGLIMLAAISQKQNLFLVSPSWVLSGVSGISADIKPGPSQPFAFPFKGEAQCLYLGQDFPFLACFWTTCSYLLICETQSPTRDLWEGSVFVFKKHSFFGRAVSVWTWREV